jgi:hypothetical protein
MSELPGLLDGDGYPTDEALAAIKAWPITHVRPMSDHVALFDYVRDAFSGYGYFGVTDEPEGKRIYHVSTGGWSGCEDVIGALQENLLFWSLAWASSRRGGHYEFEVKL